MKYFSQILKQLFTVVFLLSTFSIAAQNVQNVTIKGSLVDIHDQELPFSNVSVYNLPDSSFITGVNADLEGKFSIQTTVKSGYLKISLLGFKDQYISIPKGKSVFNTGVIRLLEDNQLLGEVVVTGERNQLNLQLDKRVFHVGSNVSSQGASAVEILENIPSITVDEEGNVSLRGNQNVRILIDGKYSGLASSGDALQQLQANMIESVEVVTNASARYDAQGEAGIVNIILKKNSLAGWNGSANLIAGYNPNYGGGFNVSYRKNNVNLYANYSLMYRENPGTSTTYQRYTGPDTSFVYRQKYNHARTKLGHNAMLGFDYDINSYNTLSASAILKSGLGNNNYTRIYDDLDLNDIFLGSSERSETQKELEDYYEGSVSYKRKFEKKDKLWTVDFRWFNDKDIEKSDYTEKNSYNTHINYENSTILTEETNWLFQSDFIQPIFSEGKLEIGVRSQMRHIRNAFSFAQLVADQWVNPSQFNDDYKYLENIHAAYIQGSNSFGRFSLQAGMRAEYSDINAIQLSLNHENKRNYLNWFPSAALSYKLNEINTLQFSYSRRVNRPGQWDLLPFTKFGDNREMRTGNPNLDPEFINSLEGGMLQQWDKGSLLSSIYFRNTNNVIQRMATVDADGIVKLTPMNLATQNSYGFEFNLNYSFTSWLRFNTGLNLFHALIQGSFEGEELKASAYSLNNRSSLNATIAKKLKVQTSFNYMAPRNNAQGKQLSSYFLDAGISYELLKGNALIAFNVRDIFNTRRWRSIRNTDILYAETDFQWRPRSFQLTFTYRFNQRNNSQQESRDFEDMREEG